MPAPPSPQSKGTGTIISKDCGLSTLVTRGTRQRSDINHNNWYTTNCQAQLQDTRQIVAGNTDDIENNDKKGGSRFLSKRQLMKKQAGAELCQAQGKLELVWL